MSARVCLVSDSPRPLPGFTSWPTFPFEGDIRIKKLDDPVSLEPPRHGENPSECRACSSPDEAYIWVSERWRVRSLDRPTGLPMVLILESRSHLDLGDLPNLLAAELGVMTVRLERAVRSLDDVARVHVNRWGDGSAHLHLWFLARPYGRLQLRGTFLSLWDEILPTISESQWRENLALVAAWLAEFGGRPLAEPPRIDWKAPASLSPTAATSADERTEASSTGRPAPGADRDEPTEDRAATLLRAIEGDLTEPGALPANAPFTTGPFGSAPGSIPGRGAASGAGTATAPARSVPAQRTPVDAVTQDPVAGDGGSAEAGGAKSGAADGGASVPAGDSAADAGRTSEGDAGRTSEEAGGEQADETVKEPAHAGANPAGANPAGANPAGAKADASAPTGGAKPAGAVKTVSGAKQSDRGKQSGRARSGGRDRG
jgi:hypothetical protein